MLINELSGTLSGRAPLPFYAVFSRPNGGQLLISSYRSKMNKIQPLRTEPFLIGIRYTGKQTGGQKKVPPLSNNSSRNRWRSTRTPYLHILPLLGSILSKEIL